MHIARKNCIGKVAEEKGMIWVIRRMETNCFSVVCDHLFEFLRPTELRMGKKRIGKLVEGSGTIWVARRMETEFYVALCDIRLFRAAVIVSWLRNIDYFI